jgi:hypothetical protein
VKAERPGVLACSEQRHRTYQARPHRLPQRDG